MFIYSNQKTYFEVLLKQERFVKKDLTHDKNWAETNDRMPISLGIWHPIHNKMLNMKL